MLDVAYCITAIVHGDIRHLERTAAITALSLSVHGDIRHLEKLRYHLVTDKVGSNVLTYQLFKTGRHCKMSNSHLSLSIRMTTANSM